MKTAITLATGTLLLAAGPALAQDAPEALDPAHMDSPEAQAESPPMEDDSTTDTAAPSFTDAEIAAFVEAATAIRAMPDDGSVDDATRQAEAEAIVAGHGLDVDTYSAIGTAAQTDPAVAARVQAAIEAQETSEDS